MVVLARIAVALLASSYLCSTTFGQEKPKIYLGASSKTLGYSPLWVATKKGFFDQQGLDVQLVLLRGVPMTVQALAASSFLIAGKNYKTYEDLRGATFGTASLTGGTITALREALKLKGLEYPRDYKLLIIAGGSSANLAALQSGQIAATTVAVPLNYAAEEAGLNVIGRLSEGIPHFQTNAFVTRRSWAEKNRPVMVRFMRAMVLTFRWMFENRDAAVEFLSKEMQLKPLHARKGWEFYTQNRFWPPDGDVTMEGMKTNVRIYAEQTGAKSSLPDAGKYVDQSYLREAIKDIDKQ